MPSRGIYRFGSHSGGSIRRVGSVAKRKTFGDVPLHELSNDWEGAAYGETQTNERIKTGDLLEIPEQKVAGMMYSAWPTVATEATAGMHQATDPEAGLTNDPRTDRPGDPDYSQRYRLAQRLAAHRGYPLDTVRKKDEDF